MRRVGAEILMKGGWRRDDPLRNDPGRPRPGLGALEIRIRVHGEPMESPEPADGIDQLGNGGHDVAFRVVVTLVKE